MRSASYTGQFKRDVNVAEKRGKDMGKLRVMSSACCWPAKLSRATLATTLSKANGSQAATFILNPIGS